MPDAPPAPTLRELIRADFAHAARQGASFRFASGGLLRKVSMALEPSIACVLLHRLAHAAWQRGARRIAVLLATINRVVLRAAIDPAAEIGPGLYIPHPSAVLFAGSAGRDLVVFANAVIAPAGCHPRLVGVAGAGPHIGDGVVVGFNALILGGIDIGDGARIGGGAVVTRSVPAGGTSRSPFRGLAR